MTILAMANPCLWFNDYFRYGYVYFISRNSDNFEKFMEFNSELERQIGRLDQTKDKSMYNQNAKQAGSKK